jgi:TM2 domain-containing membrane protein YozV
MTMRKFLLTALIVFVWIFVAVFLFNHLNAWIGLAFAIGGFASSLLYLETKFKNNKEK